MRSAGGIEDKVAIVTGASRGLGLRLSRALAENGARVAMLARGKAALDQAAAEIGPAAFAVGVDLSVPVAVHTAFEQVKAHFGGIDILINNAAVGMPQKIETLDDETLQTQVAANLLAPIYCMREAVPEFRRRGGGHIVNISSDAAGRPFPYLALYGATKAALESFSRSLREEVRADRIRVTIVRCGRMSASAISAHWPSEVRARYVEEMTATGTYRFAGGPIAPEITAEAILDILRLPLDAHVDFIELRSNIPFP